jgi:predicted ATPase with chaperone activity
MAFVGTTELHQEHQKKIKEVFTEVGKVVVGQEYMVNRLLAGLFTNGHILLEGVPGLAKTLTISTLARVLHLDFQRNITLLDIYKLHQKNHNYLFLIDYYNNYTPKHNLFLNQY